MKASQKNARISPKKANLIAGMVRNMKVTEALDQLKFTPKKGAQILYKIIQGSFDPFGQTFRKGLPI